MTTRVYQILIDDAKYKEVNEKGWDGVEWGSDYHAMTFGPGRNDDITALVKRVIDHGLVVHTKTIETDDLDEVFAAGNGYGRDETVVHTHCEGKSISVGDILVNTETLVGQIVDSFGFIGVAPALVREMECKVTTTLKEGVS